MLTRPPDEIFDSNDSIRIVPEGMVNLDTIPCLLPHGGGKAPTFPAILYLWAASLPRVRARSRKATKEEWKIAKKRRMGRKMNLTVPLKKAREEIGAFRKAAFEQEFEGYGFNYHGLEGDCLVIRLDYSQCGNVGGAQIRLAALRKYAGKATLLSIYLAVALMANSPSHSRRKIELNEIIEIFHAEGKGTSAFRQAKKRWKAALREIAGDGYVEIDLDGKDESFRFKRKEIERAKK